MQVPVSSNQGPDKRYEGNNSNAYQAQTALVLTMESQLRLRSLHDYVDGCRATLDEIHADLSFFESHSGDPECLRRSAERLKTFCLDADSWGFDALYEIAWRLQILMLDSGSRTKGGDYWDLLHRGLAILSSLLEQCESDFRRRLAVADMLENLDQALHQ